MYIVVALLVLATPWFSATQTVTCMMGWTPSALGFCGNDLKFCSIQLDSGVFSAHTSCIAARLCALGLGMYQRRCGGMYGMAG
eukprot:scaffold243186_cov25-Prasinocladus_malaysianus.AAC.1